ncbi:MAG: hypothetical protein J6B01_04355 [Ruminococcus sp.]|nr:hypothetical protein [Ruminococcus sp.]
MRTLKFIVDKQIIKRDPNCDFSDIVAGTEGYLQAEFSFSPDWNGCVKVVEFTCRKKECPPQLLGPNNTCIIPAEALVGKSFGIRVMGQKNGLKLTSNKIVTFQKGGIK